MFLSNFIEIFNKQNNNTNSFLNELNNYLKKPSSAIYTIDRIEGKYAVCENSQTLKMENILLSKLPSNIKDGTVIKLENGNYCIDKRLQEKRKKEIHEKTKKAWKE